MADIKEIQLSQFENIKIGQAENSGAGTGVTVVVAPKGAPCGLDIVGTLANHVMCEAIKRSVS